MPYFVEMKTGFRSHDLAKPVLNGSTRYLWKEAEIEATIQYVVNEQGLPMALFENKNRTFNTAI